MSEVKNVAGGAQGTLVEVRSVTGGLPVPSLTLVQADQQTIVGDGSHERELRAGPAGELGAYVVVFRPGGVAGENVAVTWSQALEFLGKLQGTRVLQFDDSLQRPVVIPLPATPGDQYPMTDVTWSGGGAGTEASLVQVNQGVRFSGLRRFDERVQVLFTGTSPPVTDFDVSTPVPDTVVFDHGARLSAVGSGPFFRVSVSGGSGVAFEILGGSAIESGSHAAIDLAVSGVLTGITVEGSGSELQSRTVSGIAGSILSLLVGSSGISGASEIQSSFAGALVPVNATKLRRFPTSILTGNAVLTQTSQLVRVDPTGGPLSVTLPPAVNHRGESVSVKNVTSSANGVTIAAAGGDTIDGAASLVLSAARFFLEVTSDGVSGWLVTGETGLASAVSLQVFTYTVTGLEPDLSQITVALPVAMPSANYGVAPACQGVTNIAEFDVTGQTTTHFVIDATGSLQAGDQVVFFVSALT